MTYPEIGSLAPDFTLPDDEGSTIKLSKYRGKRVVLYFYPRADTPGCTIEACEFRDDYQLFDEEDIVVLGISPDSIEDEAKFKEKFQLPFPLLADEKHEVAERYGTWQKKPDEMGVARTTFLIDADGNIEKIYKKVVPEGHAKEILDLYSPQKQ